MGLNDEKRSFIVGIAPDGASYPKRPLDRGAGPSNVNDGGANPNILWGAVVHGPAQNGAYQDARTAAQHNGVSILNNSPLSLLIASLRSRNLKLEHCIGLRPRKFVKKTEAQLSSDQSKLKAPIKPGA
jgi:hypothetical protein